MGACSAEGVGGPAGTAGRRLGLDYRSFHPSLRVKKVKRHNNRFCWLTRDVAKFRYPLQNRRFLGTSQSYIRECMKASFNFPAHGQVHPQISQLPARSGTELPYLAISYLKIAHWSILLRGIEGHGDDLDENGCFTSRTCVLRLDRYGSSGHFLFENRSLVDFT